MSIILNSPMKLHVFPVLERKIKYIHTISQPEDKNHHNPGFMCFVALFLRLPLTCCFLWSLLLHTLV